MKETTENFAQNTIEFLEEQTDLQVAEIRLIKIGQKKYLKRLIGRIFKILHLIENEEITGYSAKLYIWTLILDINSFNKLIDGDLTTIIVNLNWIYYNYRETDFQNIRKRVFENKKEIDLLIKKLED